MVHLLLLTTLSLSSAVATSQPTTWEEDYGKALAATRADDRPLLVVLDVPGDDKKAVESEQLKTDGDQADLLAKYQLCHVDVSTDYGKRVAKAFKATSFPFTAIIDKTGSYVLTKKKGQLTDSEWKETLAAYKTGVRTSATHYTSAYRGTVIESGSMFSYPASTPSISSPSYCPSCQRNAQRNF